MGFCNQRVFGSLYERSCLLFIEAHECRRHRVVMPPQKESLTDLIVVEPEHQSIGEASDTCGLDEGKLRPDLGHVSGVAHDRPPDKGIDTFKLFQPVVAPDGNDTVIQLHRLTGRPNSSSQSSGIIPASPIRFIIFIHLLRRQWPASPTVSIDALILHHFYMTKKTTGGFERRAKIFECFRQHWSGAHITYDLHILRPEPSQRAGQETIRMKDLRYQHGIEAHEGALCCIQCHRVARPQEHTALNRLWQKWTFAVSPDQAIQNSKIFGSRPRLRSHCLCLSVVIKKSAIDIENHAPQGIVAPPTPLSKRPILTGGQPYLIGEHLQKQAEVRPKSLPPTPFDIPSAMGTGPRHFHRQPLSGYSSPPWEGPPKRKCGR